MGLITESKLAGKETKYNKEKTRAKTSTYARMEPPANN
jgi:hypothetical protein